MTETRKETGLVWSRDRLRKEREIRKARKAATVARAGQVKR